jgi:hypothetical protein
MTSKTNSTNQQNYQDVQLCPGVQLHPQGHGHWRVKQVDLEGQKELTMFD